MSDDSRYRFAVGDTVRVANIVGPRMTISKITTSPNGGVLVQCFWFNRRFEFQGRDFPPRFLAKASAWVDRLPHVDGEPANPDQVEEMADAAD